MSSKLFSVVLAVTVLGWGARQLSAAGPDGAPANIRVNLPADAALTIDGTPTKSTSANRWFETPPLPQGQSFAYILKADFVRDGKTITVQQKVWVRAGEETVASLEVPGQAVAVFPNATGSNLYYAPEASITTRSPTRLFTHGERR